MLTLSLLLGGCVYLPQPALPDPATLAPAARAAQNQRVFAAAWNLVRRGYFSPDYNGVDWRTAYARHLATAVAATSDAELYDAINELLAELHDDHTHALSARETDDMDRAERVLLGLILRPLDLHDETAPRVVMATMPESSAEEAGVEPGWILVSCDDRPPQEVLAAGRLAAGQVVHCVFQDHTDHDRALALTARRVSVKPVMESRVERDGILYLRFDKFDSTSARWLRQQLKTHAQAPGVVLDLRQNPGGDAAALGRMLGEFFTERVAMGRFITRRGLNDELRAWRWLGSARYSGPIAVLVSGASASSAEIFAAVVQHHRRALVLGETTNGAVLASRFFPLPGGGRLQMAIDDYVTPAGQRLEGNGVTPERIIVPTPADLRAGRDPVLAAAVEYVREKARP